MAAPFALTYTAQAAELPAWQSYTQSATLTTTALWTVATLDANGAVTFISGRVVQTAYGTQVVQLPITVDVPYSVGEPYTTPGGTGPTLISVLGASAAITLQPPSQSLPPSTRTAPGGDTSTGVTATAGKLGRRRILRGATLIATRPLTTSSDSRDLIRSIVRPYNRTGSDHLCDDCI